MSDEIIDYRDNALDLFIDGVPHARANRVVGMRRRGTVICFGIDSTTVILDANEAQEIADSLSAAARLAREEQRL